MKSDLKKPKWTFIFSEIPAVFKIDPRIQNKNS